MEKTNMFIFFNELYRRLNVKNEVLSPKADKNPNYDVNTVFNDAVTFSITTHGMAFIKNILLKNKSIGNYSNIRGIIEGLALLELEKSGLMKEKNIRMFAESWKIKEHIMYSELKDQLPSNSNIDLEIMKQNYNQFIKDYFNDLSSNKIRSLGLIQYFFLYDISKDLLKPYGLVKKFCNEKLFEIYQNVSVVTHPHRYGYYAPSLEQDYINSVMIMELFELSNTFSMNYPTNKGFIEEYNTFMTNPINQHFLMSFIYQKNALLHLSNEFKLFFKDDNFVSGCLDDIAGLYCEMHYASIVGLNEDVKIKVKTILEVLATFINIYQDKQNLLNNDEYRFRLITQQTKIELWKRYHQNDEKQQLINKDLLKAFEIYRNINKIDQDKFNKIFVSNSMAFMIDENGECPTITSFVDRAIDSLYKDNDNIEISNFKKVIKIYYRESQAIAHTSGYLYFSNDFIFSGEENNVYIILDNILLNIVRFLLIYFKFHNITEGSDQYLKIIESAQKAEEIFKCETEKKVKIYTNYTKVNKNLFF